MGFYKNNSIWLIKEKEPNMLLEGRLVVSNPELWKETTLKLNDISNYIATGEIPDIKNCDGGVLYTNFGAIERLMDGHGNPFTRKYMNPQWFVNKLLTGTINPGLLGLFATLEYGWDKVESEFECAKAVINELESSSLSGETIKTILQKMWPNFGIYATDGLDCTEIKIEKRYDLHGLETAIHISKEHGIEVSSELREIFGMKEGASTNGKVLTLARKANLLSKR